MNRRAIRMLAAALALAGWGTAAAVPPPPAPVPPSLARLVEGYDLQTLYQRWRYWVEAHKGEAAEALLAAPDPVEGEVPFGEPLLRFSKYNDFGHFLTGEIRAYCRTDERGRAVPDSCHYRLRRAFVAHDSGGEDNPVALWARENFDSARVAERLRSLGLAPDTDWWRLDTAPIFAALPSPLAVLTAHATVVRLDSRECPALAAALGAIERGRIDWPVDLLGVGRDGTPFAPPSHAIRVVYRLRLVTPGGGIAVAEGDSRALGDLVGPALDAADHCERERGRSG